MNSNRLARRTTVLLLLTALQVSFAAAETRYRATLLHPLSEPSYNHSVANAVAGEFQGGEAAHSVVAAGGFAHAVLWKSSGENYVNLTPAGSSSSEIMDISETHQVGVVNSHAALWNGTAESFVDLNPAGFNSSRVRGIYGDRQVGSGTIVGRERALVWSGSAESVVNLHPSGYVDSGGAAIFENHQVGSVTYHPPGQASEQHAALWNGTADSFVDLHPVGYVGSYAAAVWGNQQAGRGRIGFDNYALLWKGTAESVVSLHPDGFESSYVNDMFAGQQVGAAQSTTGSHALLWNSSADDYVDLHPFLADLPVTILRSIATGISADGRIVGYGFTTNGGAMALLWAPVPEPGVSVYVATILLMSLGCNLQRSLHFRS